jgi:hypothetical protein
VILVSAGLSSAERHPLGFITDRSQSFRPGAFREYRRQSGSYPLEGYISGFFVRATAGYCFSPLFGLRSVSPEFAALLEISSAFSEALVGMLNRYSRGFVIRSLRSEIFLRRIIWGMRVNTGCILIPKRRWCPVSRRLIGKVHMGDLLGVSDSGFRI